MENEKQKKSILDSIKLGLLDRFENLEIREQLIQSISNDELKIDTIRGLKNEKEKLSIILKSSDKIKSLALDIQDWWTFDEKAIVMSIEDDNLKLEAIDKYSEHLKNYYIKNYSDYDIDTVFSEPVIMDCVASIKDDKMKVKFLDRIKVDSPSVMEVISTIQDDEAKFECIDKIVGINEKLLLIDQIKDDSLKLRAIDKFENESLKVYIIQGLINDNLKLEYINKIENVKSKLNIISSINDDTVKIKSLDIIDSDTIKLSRQLGIFSIELISNNIDKFIQKEINDDKDLNIEYMKNKINDMSTRNNEVCQTINFRLLDEKYLKDLGQDKIDVIACYPNTQENIIKLNDNQYNSFVNLLNEYERNENTTEWKVMANTLLTAISSNTYNELIDNIQNVDIENNAVDVINILSNELNYFNVKSIEDVQNIEQIQNKVYELIKNNNEDELQEYEEISKMDIIDRKKFLVLQKAYGQDLLTAQTLINKYGEDISSLNDNEDIELKDYINSLKTIIEVDNENILDDIIKDENIEGTKVNSIAVERNLKTAYAKQFNKNLLKVEDMEQLKDNNFLEYDVRDAGVDFQMMVTSVSPYHTNTPENFCTDWNRNTLSSQGFCCSYIRNDMLGTAPKPHFCYGFDEMEEDSLMLSGARDMWSDTAKLDATTKHCEKYYSPDNQINNSSAGNGWGSYYNEMVYRRIQDDKRKQPDYIVLFKGQGKINEQSVLEAKKAVDDYKNNGIILPIVVIDKDKCEQSEKTKIDSMLEEYENTQDIKILKQIKQRIDNNTKGNANFKEYTSKIKDIPSEEIIEQKVESKNYNGININEYEENHNKVTVVERSQESSKLSKVALQLKNKFQQFEK